MNEEIKKIINQIEDRLALHTTIEEPISKDLDKAIKLSVAYEELLEENKQLKEQLEASENARREAIEYIKGVAEMTAYTKSMALYEEEIDEVLSILDIDKGVISNE